jgi:predicted DNA-binding protein
MSNVVDLRTRQFNVRLNEDEAERLDQLAAHYSVSPATVVRLLIKARSDELAAESSKKKPARKR